jgi:hypothetical protein
MATRYEVRWADRSGRWFRHGFAFGDNAARSFGILCEDEAEGRDVCGVVLEYLGPNGERAPYPIEVSVPVGGVGDE